MSAKRALRFRLAYRLRMGRGSGKGQAAIATRGVLPLAQVPTVELEEVFHVGTLRAEDKGVAHSSSWEGHGLSFSLDPAAWERIARLGGAPWWSLRRRGGRFLDYWRYGPYSAPRGVILPSRVGAWQPERIERFDGAHE